MVHRCLTPSQRLFFFSSYLHFFVSSIIYNMQIKKKKTSQKVLNLHSWDILEIVHVTKRKKRTPIFFPNNLLSSVHTHIHTVLSKTQHAFYCAAHTHVCTRQEKNKQEKFILQSIVRFLHTTFEMKTKRKDISQKKKNCYIVENKNKDIIYTI